MPCSAGTLVASAWQPRMPRRRGSIEPARAVAASLDSRPLLIASAVDHRSQLGLGNTGVDRTNGGIAHCDLANAEVIV